MDQNHSWPVIVYFVGLILFVREPGEGDKIKYALMLEGREGHHHHGSTYPPKHSSGCEKLAREDFHHIPMLHWKQGKASGEHELRDRVRIELVWTTGDGEEGPEATLRGASPIDTDSVGSLPSLHSRPQPAWSFGWVPNLDEFAGHAIVSKSCYGTRDVPSVVFAQLPLVNGQIGTASFGWIEMDEEQWVMRLNFDAGPGGGADMKRAAAEQVVWFPDPPEAASKLQICARQLDHGIHETEGLSDHSCALIHEFDLSQGKIELRMSNDPKERCQYQGHPGRSLGMLVSHFDMFYSALSSKPNDGGRKFEQHVHGKHRSIPWLPEELDRRWPGRNAVRIPRYLLDPQTFANQPMGYVHRPICIPAVADTE